MNLPRRIGLCVTLAGLVLAPAACAGGADADDIALALQSDGASEEDARCVADQAVESDLSTDSLQRLAQEGIVDDQDQDVQFIDDDIATLQAIITACLE